MSGVGPFVDVEGLMIDWFTSQLPTVRFCTELPADIEGLELVRVTRSPGSNDETQQRPRVDVEAFAASRARMWVVIGLANDAVAKIKGQQVNGIQVDCPYTITDPVAAWWSPTVYRAVAVYEIPLRVYGPLA